MRLTSLFFLLHEALSGLVRHRLMALAAVSTSAICFTLMGAFLAALYTLQAVARDFTSELGVMAFMKTDASRGETERARKAIADLPGVASVTIVTKEAAWTRMKKDYGQLPLEGIVKNPLGDELHIQMRDVEHIAPVAKAVDKVDGVDEVSVMREVVKKVQATERVVKRLGAGTAIFLLLATLAVIANVIRLTVYARKREIRIMQLVGATNAFIRLPFLLEGFIYGTVGAGIGAAVVYFGGSHLLRFGHNALPFLPLDPTDLPVRALLAMLLTAGALIGLLGSAASMHKFLKT